jgi:hypothetical protein
MLALSFDLRSHSKVADGRSGLRGNGGGGVGEEALSGVQLMRKSAPLIVLFNS